MTQQQIIEQIKAMPKEQWFTGNDIAKYNPRVGLALVQLEKSEEVHEEHVLIGGAGMQNACKFMWTNHQEWTERIEQD
jgi:hypothetical protein